MTHPDGVRPPRHALHELNAHADPACPDSVQAAIEAIFDRRFGRSWAQSVLARAFEPYVTTKTKGTGLGLAVVKKIADEHRAAVRIVNLQDEPGGAAGGTGARVSLSFPNPASSIAPAPAAAVPGGSVHTG